MVTSTDRERVHDRLRRIVANLGAVCALRFIYHRLTSWAPRDRSFFLSPKSAMFPLEVRPRTSDLDVFGQIFAGDEYGDPVADLEAEVIIDGGANVGYSAAYFLTRFPRARVVSIEPDAENFAVLTRNLEPYGDRVDALLGALWSHAGEVSLLHGFRDGRSWSVQVTAARADDDATVPAFGMADLLDRIQRRRISILKLDIEGAEFEVFSRNTDAWLGLVDTFIVELHDDAGFGDATKAFHDALDGLAPVYQRSGELMVARMPRE